ncbi:MAG TPA: amidohydrolase family protein [Acidimicrobiia bacterium]|nr:amidohydrolase family protein [Acidimicrobiia bacterium]
MLDVKIAGGSVVDGTGAARRRADVGIEDGRLVQIGDVDESAARTIDASGLIVAPGFVDIHTHYDAQAFWDPALTPSPLHGVTTIVGGNCGFTIAPLAASEADYLMRMLARVEGMPLESLAEGVPWNWHSFGEYLDRLDGTLAVNAGFLVGHSALRRVVMGEAAVGSEATPEQTQQMAALLSESIAAGGLGFSSSQAPTHNDGDGNPVPSRAATRDELISLARVVGNHPGTTLEFIPTVGAFADEHVELMTDMSLAANRPLNWNVLVVGAGTDGYLDQLAASDRAAERGGRVLALTVPCVMQLHLNFRSGFLFDALPGWGPTMALPLAEKRAALDEPAVRTRLREAAESDAGLFGRLLRWDRLRVGETFAPENESLAGQTIGEIAAQRGQHPFDTLCDIAIADDLCTDLLPPSGGDDAESWRRRAEVWRDHRAVVGASDAGAHLDMLATFNYTTSLLAASRAHDLVGLEEAVHLLTDVPARLYGIRERGRIAEGWRADLVMFDERRVAPAPVQTRYDLPAGAGRLYAGAEGVEHVLVNGVEIVRSGELTGDRPGTLLRSGRDTETVEAADVRAG